MATATTTKTTANFVLLLRPLSRALAMPFQGSLDMASAPTVWMMLGWKSGRSLAIACREAAQGLPSALGTVDFLEVLKATWASVQSWDKLETTLRHIASRPNQPSQAVRAPMAARMPNAASVAD